MADFAVRLRQLRKERQLRQVDLAGHLGIAQTTVANYEQHARFPDEEMLLSMASFFEVSLDYLLGRSDVSIPPDALAAATATPTVAALEPLARDYLVTLRGGNREEAFDLILGAADAGMRVGEIYTVVLEPTLRVVGSLWESGEVDISEEHYFSEATETLMARLHPYIRARKPALGNAVLTAAGPEGHRIGVRMVGDLLEEAGWRPYYLGGNVPVQSVSLAVERERAQVLAVSATMPAHVDSVMHTITFVRSHRTQDSVPLSVIVGGAPFNLDPELWKRVGADGHARSATEAADLVRGLIG